MKKYLVNSEKECVSLFKSFVDAEIFLNIEFAFVDGTYQSDIGKNPSIDESQDIDIKVYRKNKDSIFPEEYPCLVILENEKDFDRQGEFQIQIFDFVYQKDFLKT